MLQPMFVHAHEHRIAFHSFNLDGHDPPIVFIHGITSNIDYWPTVQTPPLRPSRRWLSLSLPGHYPATFPPGFHLDSFTADVVITPLVDALDSILGDRTFVLVGHSTGGFAAMGIAAAMSDQVRGLVSVSGFAHGQWTGLLGKLQALAQSGTVGKLCFNLAGFVFGWQKLLMDNDPHLRDLDMTAMLAYFRHMPDIDISDRLPQITAPTLVIVGENDPLVPVTQSHLIAQHVPNATLLTIPDCGHTPMEEQPALYHNALLDWLRANDL